MNNEKHSLNNSEKEAVFFHSIFAITCVIVLFIPLDISIGLRLFILVILYNTALPVTGIIRKHRNWTCIWSFTVIISILMVIPDWYLADVLDVLVFPEDGFLKIGPVSGYMALLWTIPLFIIVFCGISIQQRYNDSYALIAAGILSIVIFGLSEETLWILPSWHAQNVTMIDHVAVYIIIPEVILGMTAFKSYDYVKDKKLYMKVIVAMLVMIIYLGSASLFYLMVERILL